MRTLSTETVRYIFTVTTGRSGQAALADLIARHVPGAYAAFEEPRVSPRLLPAQLWGFERRFRRRFIETDELLGRGNILDAYARGDDAYIVRTVRRRQRSIVSVMGRLKKSVYVDVSKFFARGMHCGWAQILPEFSLIRLVRDPVCMMRSFLNRHKDFTRDNNLPDAEGNILRLESHGLDIGELYLWSWFEMYLRHDALVERHHVRRAVDIRSEDLNDPKKMEAAFTAIELAHTTVVAARQLNTNVEKGFGITRPHDGDIALFERFLDRIPERIRQRIRYLDTYDPRRQLMGAPAPR